MLLNFSAGPLNLYVFSLFSVSYPSFPLFISLCLSVSLLYFLENVLTFAFKLFHWVSFLSHFSFLRAFCSLKLKKVCIVLSHEGNILPEDIKKRFCPNTCFSSYDPYFLQNTCFCLLVWFLSFRWGFFSQITLFLVGPHLGTWGWGAGGQFWGAREGLPGHLVPLVGIPWTWLGRFFWKGSLSPHPGGWCIAASCLGQGKRRKSLHPVRASLRPCFRP